MNAEKRLELIEKNLAITVNALQNFVSEMAKHGAASSECAVSFIDGCICGASIYEVAAVIDDDVDPSEVRGFLISGLAESVMPKELANLGRPRAKAKRKNMEVISIDVEGKTNQDIIAELTEKLTKSLEEKVPANSILKEAEAIIGASTSEGNTNGRDIT